MGLVRIPSDGQGGCDRVMAALVQRLGAAGVTVCGAVQSEQVNARNGRCDVMLRCLPAGPVFKLSQDLGAGATGCRLDPDALEGAVAAAGRGLDGAGLLVVNRFGKQEAAGRGFCALIGEALSRSVPVLVAVSPRNLEAFMRFSGGLSRAMPADEDALWDWVRPGAAPVSAVP